MGGKGLEKEIEKKLWNSNVGYCIGLYIESKWLCELINTKCK